MNPEPPRTVNGYWMPTIVFNSDTNFDREILINALKANNIDARVFFWPLTMMGFFQNNTHHIDAYHIYKNAINLPSYHDMSEIDLHRITACIRAGTRL